ncbi:MAG: hypothetical protein NDJ94_24050 [Vicinamibacteria bacterium]|nr:hypothetical protein [Vicinamibacteria bacterium]
MAFRVDTPDDYDRLAGEDAEEDGIRELREEDTSDITVDDGVGQWSLSGRKKRDVHGVDEGLAEARSLLLVPVMRLLDVGFRSRPKEKLHRD